MFSSFMARLFGNFDYILSYKDSDIEKDFYDKHKKILSNKIGGGYWLWKPYFVLKTLKMMNYGDYLFYSDSGAFFYRKVDHLIKNLNESDQDVMGFEALDIEYQCTKAELFENMECDDDYYRNSNHLIASYFLIKKTKKSMHFFKEFLYYCSFEDNITEQCNIAIQKDDLLKHVHDESIFSLLYKKYQYRPFRNISQFGISQNQLYFDEQGISLEANKVHLFNGIKKIRFKNYSEVYKTVIFHTRKQSPLRGVIAFSIRYFLILRNPTSKFFLDIYIFLNRPYSSVKIPFTKTFKGKKFN